MTIRKAKVIYPKSKEEKAKFMIKAFLVEADYFRRKGMDSTADSIKDGLAALDNESLANLYDIIRKA